MLQATDISVTFTPSNLPNSKSIGYGQINIVGVIIAYSVFPSQYNLGFMVSYPSKPVMKNGVQEREPNGRPKYFNEVYVADANTRGMIENAVLNAMLNKGIDPSGNVNQQPQTGFQPRQNTQPQTGFQQPVQTQQYINGQGVSSSPSTFSPGSSVVGAKDLPF